MTDVASGFLTAGALAEAVSRTYAIVSPALRIARHFEQITTRPWRGSVDVKFTRVRSARTTFTDEIVVPQTGHTAGYSSVYSASLSRTSALSSR